MTDPRLRPDQVQHMRAMLVSAVEAEPARAKKPRVARSIVLGVVSVGAIAAVVAVVNVVAPARQPALQTQQTPTAPAPAQPASTMLLDAAMVTTDPEVAEGQFLKLATSASYLALTTVDGSQASTIGYLESRLREVYVPADSDGSSVAQTTDLAPTVFFGEGAQEFAAREWSGQPVSSAVQIATSDDATRPIEDQSAMPRDPVALLDYLTQYRYQAGSSDENVFAHVVDLLRTGDVKSDLRAALYRALALMPAVAIVEKQATLDGRVGTAIGLRGDVGDTRQEIVIDAVSGEFIGVRLVTIHGFGEIPPGTALEATALSATVVDAVPR